MMKLFSLNLLLPSLILSEEIEVRIPRTCKTTSGDACRFPFKFQGKTYYKCTYASSPTPWCATMVDRSGVVVTNRWPSNLTIFFSNRFCLYIGGVTVTLVIGFLHVRLTRAPQQPASQVEAQDPTDLVSFLSDTMERRTPLVRILLLADIGVPQPQDLMAPI